MEGTLCHSLFASLEQKYTFICKQFRHPCSEANHLVLSLIHCYHNVPSIVADSSWLALSFVIFVFRGTTPLAAMACSSSVTDPKCCSGLFLFNLAQRESFWRSLFIYWLKSCLLHLPSLCASLKLESANRLADYAKMPHAVSQPDCRTLNVCTRKGQQPPTQGTPYHLKLARGALHALSAT